MRIFLDNNVPVGVRRLLPGYDVASFSDLTWTPKLENGKLLQVCEKAGFDVMITSDQNIKHQRILSSRKLALVVLGSNILQSCAAMQLQPPKP